jgi:preprotein translocase subunit SecG
VLIALAILAVVVALIGVVMLWRSSSGGAPNESDGDTGSERLIDVVPPGPGS